MSIGLSMNTLALFSYTLHHPALHIFACVEMCWVPEGSQDLVATSQQYNMRQTALGSPLSCHLASHLPQLPAGNKGGGCPLPLEGARQGLLSPEGTK